MGKTCQEHVQVIFIRKIYRKILILITVMQKTSFNCGHVCPCGLVENKHFYTPTACFLSLWMVQKCIMLELLYFFLAIIFQSQELSLPSHLNIEHSTVETAFFNP